MSDYSQIIDSKDYIQFLPKSNLLSKYKYIAIDPLIHGGHPHIRGTRIVCHEVFIAQMEKISINKLILEYKSMDISVSANQLKEAFEFTLESIRQYIRGKKTAKK